MRSSVPLKLWNAFKLPHWALNIKLMEKGRQTDRNSIRQLTMVLIKGGNVGVVRHYEKTNRL